MKNLYVRLSANVTEFRQQLGAAASSTRAFGKAVEGEAAKSAADFQKIGKAGIIAGGLIVAGLGAAVAVAARFEQRMRNANSIMHQSEAEFRATSAAVLDLSRKVPQSAATLADGLYDVASSGFQGAEGLKVLEASAIAATAGMSDTATAARAITGVLNAYGMEAEEAGHVSDVLFQTVNVGVVTFDELAQNVGDFISTAAALGITVEETGAALATMTLAGINAAEASTALNRVMSSFIKPTDAMNSAIRSLGYESGVAMVAELGLKGAVEAIDMASQGSVQSIAEMYGEVRAIKGALALGAAEGRNYAETTAAMADASDGAGAAMEAYEEQSKSFTVQLGLAKNSMGAVAIQMGTTFLPVLSTGAKMIGGVADAVAKLPGPLRTTAVLAIGLAGATALVGGAALIAVPKVAAFNAAVDGMKNNSPTAAKGLARLGGAMSLLGKGAVVVGVLTTVKAAVDALIDKVAEARNGAAPDAEAVAQSLGLLGTSGKSSSVFIQRFGDDLDGLAKSISDAKPKAEDFGGWDDAWDAVTGKKSDAKSAQDNMAALNEGFKSLFAQDPTAAVEAWNKLRAQWEASGRNVADLIVALPEVTKGLDSNQVASEQATADFAALKDEAKALGINLEETSSLAALTAEEMAELKGSTDPVIFAMTEAGTVTAEQAKVMQDALHSFVDDVRSSFAEVTAPIAIYEQALEDMNEAAKEAWDKGHENMDGFVEAASLSLGDFVTAMGDTATDTRAFVDGIHEAIAAGYDPQLIAQLLQAGPEQAGPILDTLLSDHSANVVGMVNESVEALREINEEAAEMARLLHLATTSATDEMVGELDTAMGIAQQKARLGAQGTAMEIAKALNLGIADVRRIAELYGIAIEQGIEGAHPEITYTIRPAAGVASAPVRVRARGGIDAPHVAQIAPAGAMRLWAEPETGGEAYIPLASSKRARSRAIWKETGHRLGMANGGLLRFDTGAIVRSVQHRGALEGVGMMRAGAAGIPTEQLAQVGKAYADLAYAVDEATARMLLAQHLGAEGYQEATQLIIADLEVRKRAEEEAARRAIDATRITYEEGRLSGEGYVKALKAQHAQVAREYGYWSSEAQALRQAITSTMDTLAAKVTTAQDVAFAEGRTGTAEYVAILKDRHAKIAREYGYWSDEAHKIREQIRGIEADMADDARSAAEDMVAEVDEAIGKLADLYQRTRTRFAAQQAEYDRMVEAATSRVVGELAGVYERAQDRFDAQGETFQAAVAKRNADVEKAMDDFRASIRGPVTEAGDLLATFGRDMDVDADEIVAMLDHRVEAVHRWDATLRELQGSGLDADLVQRLAQAGPEALGLATALKSVDPDVVNAAMAELDRMGTGLADVFGLQEEAAIQAKAAAETPLPAMQSFNALLAEETASWVNANAQRAAAQTWASSMASTYMPPLNFEWRTFDDLLAEEIRAQREADEERQKAEAWARQQIEHTMPELSNQYIWNTALLSNMNRELAAIPTSITTVHTIVTKYVSEGTPGRASGGSMAPNRSYLVGENGTELLTMGGAPGYISPARTFPTGSAGGGGIVVQDGAVRISVDASGGDPFAVARAAEQGATRALTKVLDAAGQGVRG